MEHFNVETAQNVEQSKKIPCMKPVEEQLRIMELYTETHRKWRSAGRERCEVECLKVLYPTMFRSIEEGDLFAGRLDFLPIGFGCVTSVGGVGHYCVFRKLKAFRGQLPPSERPRVDALYDYWLDFDVKTQFNRENLTDDTTGTFIDTAYPMIATARLSGMMLDYSKLLEKGIPGMKELISGRLASDPGNAFLQAGLECFDLLCASARKLRQDALSLIEGASEGRRRELERMAASLEGIQSHAPRNFAEAIQLFWLYALMAGAINYGRLDDLLGPYMAADLESGRLSPEDAYEYVRSLWTMIENRRTTVNGRVIVGGKGRRYPKEADVFLHVAMKVCRDCRYVEPQFTLRFDESTPEDVWDEALDALGAGATYPTLYNDEVNVPAVAWGTRIPEKEAEQYVPFGCTEFVIQGKSTGTPNICINLLKILTVYMNGGVDPVDGVRRDGGLQLPPMESIRSFEEFCGGYRKLLDWYMDRAADLQYRSYEVMARSVSFLFSSLLTDDCIERGLPLLDGGVRYLGGTCETYGNINTSDSLQAVRELVFEKRKYTLTQLRDAMLANFEGFERMRRDCLECAKYGNDLDSADGMADELYRFVAGGIRERGISRGMQYYLIVISNNQLNSDWGLTTGASPDGRLGGMYLNPANNPQGGANRCGPTAMLNSLARFDAKYHGGSVQNIKFSPGLFNGNRPAIKALFKTYFEKGGCHLMVTIVDRGQLEDAMVNPEKYPDLLVRVSGFSAVFVELPRNVQEELLSRVLYD